LESDSKIVKNYYSRIAKLMVEDGIVFRNGEPEFRKCAKLRANDVIEVLEFKIRKGLIPDPSPDSTSSSFGRRE